MALLGDSWGTREELLHPRGKNGRWIDKPGVGIATSIIDAIEKLLRAIDFREFGSDQQASQYLFNNHKNWTPEDRARLFHDLGETNAALRAGKMDTSTKKFVSMMDRQLVPSKDDLILHRRMGPEAFGITPEMMDAEDGGVWDLPGKLVADKGYSAASIGTPLEGTQKAFRPIHFAIVAPKGTKMAANGFSPSDRNVLLDRGVPIRITKVTRDGQGGYHVQGIVDDTRGENPLPLGGPEKSVATPVQREARLAPVPGTGPAEPAMRQGPAPGLPAPRNEPIHSESVGGGAPSPEAAPAAPVEPVRQKDFREAVREAGIPSPSAGPRRREWNNAYLGVASGKKDSSDALRELEKDIEVNKALLADNKKTGNPDPHLADDIKAQEQLADLIRTHHGLEQKRRPLAKGTPSGQRVSDQQIVSIAQAAKGTEKPAVTRLANERLREAERKTGQRRMTITQARHRTAVDALEENKITGDGSDSYQEIAGNIESGKWSVPRARQEIRDVEKSWRKDASITRNRKDPDTKRADEQDAVADKFHDLGRRLTESQSPAKTDKYINPPAPKVAPKAVVETPSGGVDISQMSEAQKDALIRRDADLSRNPGYPRNEEEVRIHNAAEEIRKERGLGPGPKAPPKSEAPPAKRVAKVAKKVAEPKAAVPRKAVAPKAPAAKPAAKAIPPRKKEPPFVAPEDRVHFPAPQQSFGKKLPRSEMEARRTTMTPEEVKADKLSKKVVKQAEERVQGKGLPARGPTKAPPPIKKALTSKAAITEEEQNMESLRETVANLPEGSPLRRNSQRLLDQMEKDFAEEAVFRDWIKGSGVEERSLTDGERAHVATTAALYRDGKIGLPEAQQLLYNQKNPKLAKIADRIGGAEPVKRVRKVKVPGDIETMTKPELLAHAEGLKIPVFKTWTKDKIKAAIKAGKLEGGAPVAAKKAAPEKVPGDINSMTQKELFDHATKEGIDVRKSWTKDKLKAAIRGELPAPAKKAAPAKKVAKAAPEPIVQNPVAQKPITAPDRVTDFRDAWTKRGLVVPKSSAGRTISEVIDGIDKGDLTPDEGIRRLENDIKFNNDELTDIKAARRGAAPGSPEFADLTKRWNGLSNDISTQERASTFLRKHFDKAPEVTPDEVKTAIVANNPELRSMGDRLREMSPKEVEELKREIKENPDLKSIGDIEGDTGEEVFDNALKKIIERELAGRAAKKAAKKVAPAPKAPDKPKPNLEGSPYQRLDSRALAEGLDLRTKWDQNMLDGVQAQLDGTDTSLGKNPTPARIGSNLRLWADGPAGPAYRAATTTALHQDNMTPERQREIDALNAQHAEWLKLADRLMNTRRRRATDVTPDVTPKVTPDERRDIAKVAEATGIPAPQLEKKALAKKTAEAPPKQSAVQVSETLKTVGSEDEARTLLQGRTKADLVEIAKANDVPVASRDTKPKLIDAITRQTVTRRLEHQTYLRRAQPVTAIGPTRADLADASLADLTRMEDDLGIKRTSLNREDRIAAILAQGGGEEPVRPMGIFSDNPQVRAAAAAEMDRQKALREANEAKLREAEAHLIPVRGGGAVDTRTGELVNAPEAPAVAKKVAKKAVPAKVPGDLDTMTKKELQDYAEAHNLTLRPSWDKKRMVAHIRQVEEASAAPAIAKKAAPSASAVSRIDENVPLKGDPEGDNSIMHGDSLTMELAQAYARKNRNGTANHLMDLRRSSSTTGGEDSKNIDGPQQVVDELKRLRQAEVDPELRKKLDDAIKRMDFPQKPIPDLPEGTPPALRKLLEDLNRIPLARAPKGSRINVGTTRDDSPVDRLAQLIREVADSKDQVSLDDTERKIEDILRTNHESSDGAYRMWGLWNRAGGDRGDLSNQLRDWIRGMRGGEGAGPSPQVPAVAKKAAPSAAPSPGTVMATTVYNGVPLRVVPRKGGGFEAEVKIGGRWMGTGGTHADTVEGVISKYPDLKWRTGGGTPTTGAELRDFAQQFGDGIPTAPKLSNPRQYQKQFADMTAKLADVDPNDPAALRVAAKQFRTSAKSLQGVSGMRIANNKPGSLHYESGVAGEVAAERMDRVADALEEMAKGGPSERISMSVGEDAVRHVESLAPTEFKGVHKELVRQASITPRSALRLRAVRTPAPDSFDGKAYLSSDMGRAQAYYTPLGSHPATYGLPGQKRPARPRPTIWMSPEWHGTRMPELFRRGQADGWHAPSGDATPVEAVTAHEFGHHVAEVFWEPDLNPSGTQNMRGDVARRLLPTIVDQLGTSNNDLLTPVHWGFKSDPRVSVSGDLMEDWIFHNHDLIEKLISRYGASSFYEMLAEIWMEFSTKGPSARPHIRVIGELMRDLAEELHR